MSIKLQTQGKMDDWVYLSFFFCLYNRLFPSFFLRFGLLIQSFLFFFNDLIVLSVDGRLHNSPCSEIAQLLDFCLYILVLLQFKQLLLNIEHVFKLKLFFENFELIVKAVDCQSGRLWVMNYEGIVGLIFNHKASRLYISNDHELFHHLLGGKSFVDIALYRP